MASEVVERSRSHFLTRDDEGWALWGVDQDSDDPLLSFPPDPGGEERARSAFTIRSRETRRVRWLVITAVIAGGLWAAAEVLAFYFEQFTRWDTYSTGSLFDEVRSAFPGIVARVIRAVGGIASAMFIVATGLTLVAWLHRRWRREG